MSKGGSQIEQLNIEGKRSGKGFITHKAIMVLALSRALSERVSLLDLTIGRKGLLGYLKALAGSNVVKVTPADKGIRIVCGANTSILSDSEWIGENTPMSLCQIRVSPNNSISPNVGASELADALSRVMPFAATKDDRPIFQAVNFSAKEGKLTMTGADGFTLAINHLDIDEQTGQALISLDDLKGVTNALKKAKRARVSFSENGVKTFCIDTELIRYKWTGIDGKYPDTDKLVPDKSSTFVHLDSIEASKAVNSLKALAGGGSYPIDLIIGDGKIVMANPDNKGQAEMAADITGEAVRIRVDGGYLAKAFRALGGMSELNLTDSKSPMLFTSNGYKLVVMPMLTTADQKAEPKPEPKPEPVAEQKADKPKSKPRAKAAAPA